MVLSNVARLAVAVMVDIGTHMADGPVRSIDIQDRLAIGPHRAQEVLGRLQRSGLLRLRHNVAQAYVLKRDAAVISIADIVFAFDGLLKWSPRSRQLNARPAEHLIADGLWQALDDVVGDVLRTVFLSSLLPPVTQRSAADDRASDAASPPLEPGQEEVVWAERQATVDSSNPQGIPHMPPPQEAQTDWYKTIKLGTYLVVPTGTELHRAVLPDEARALIEGIVAMPLALNVRCEWFALQFGFLGVEARVRAAGYCVLKHG